MRPRLLVGEARPEERGHAGRARRHEGGEVARDRVPEQRWREPRSDGDEREG